MRPALALLLLLSCTPACPQSDISRLLFDLRFDKIHQACSPSPPDHKDRLSELYLDNYIYFLKSLTAGDDRSYWDYRFNTDRHTEEMKALAETGPEYLHYLSLINIQSAILAIDHDNAWIATRHYYAAWRMVHYNLKQYPGYIPDLMPLGILEIIAGTIPQEYVWLMKRVGIKGTIASGQAKLAGYHARCAREDQLEATLIMALSFYQFSPQEAKAYEFLQPFSTQYSGIELYDYLLSLAAMKAGHNDVAIRILKQMVEESGSCNFPYICLLLGEAKLNRLDADANTYLMKFLEEYNGGNYVRMACHKLSWYYFLNNDLHRYEQMRGKVLTMGKNLTEADRQAFLEASDTAALNPLLLSARLLSDGGYYDKSIELLTGPARSSLRTARDSLEFFYRLGRLYQKKGDRANAIAQYRQVIKQGAGQQYYFIVNAMLQMGIIAEEEGRYHEAENYYHSCLVIEKVQYRRSIDQKAKAGLDRVKALMR